MKPEFIPEPLPATTAPLTNAMTVDLEEYFQVSAFERHIDPERWDRMPSRVEHSIDRILTLFELWGVRATFFTLAYIARRHPQTIRRIAAAGHEIASHGMRHVRVTNQDRRAFQADVTQARTILQDTTGQPVIGYRAASYSIGADNLWALDVLAEAGYLYSSSIYPVRHDRYGMPQAPRFPFRLQTGGILEIPATSVEVAGRRLPCGGGGFFRLYPYLFSRWALRRVNRRDGRPGLFYFHPWEVDPKQPRVPQLDLRTRIRHYLNLKRVEPRLRRLLTDFRWDRMDRVFPVVTADDHAPAARTGEAESVQQELSAS
jgi:polysaccharide deacetylase family protein (PEP-CTERM system associated)